MWIRSSINWGIFNFKIKIIMFSFAKYIIRLDDANEYSDMSKWDRIEKILDKNDIKPLVAVIP